MDYKAKLNANNTLIENNNTDLQSILDTINALPEVSSGGGSVDTCTVNFTTNGMGCVLHLTTINNGVVSITNTTGSTVVKTVNNVICNSVAIVEPVFTQLTDVLIDGASYGVTLLDVYGAVVEIPDKKDGTVAISATVY